MGYSRLLNRIGLQKKQASSLMTLALIGFGLTCCKGADDPEPTKATITNVTAEGTGSTVASVDAGLYVKIHTQWESDTTNTYTLHETCQIDKGTAEGEEIDCEVEIPEGQLFYGKVLFTFGTNDPETCERVVFRPYYYMMSNTAGFSPPWVDSPVDCSASPIPIDCYNGPAVDIVPGFPKYGAVYFVSAVEKEKSFQASSANQKLRTNNRWISNDLDPAYQGTARTATAGDDARIANAWSNYVFECRDRWEEPIYTINLTIRDVNSTVDHRKTWTGYE